MMPIVYIDMLFLLNLLMDTVTIYASSLILRRSISLMRLFFAAVLLSVYSCAMFFPNIKVLYSLLGKITVLILSTIIAFPSRSFGQIIKSVLTFFSVSAIFAGIMFALIFASDFGTRLSAFVSNGEIYLDIKASTLLLALTISYISIYTISYIKHHALVQSKNLAVLNIKLFSKTIHIRAFADTGCMLFEPLSNSPAIIISPKASQNLLPAHILKALKKELNTLDLGEYISRYRALPFCTIGNKNGILHGFVPDKVTINEEEILKCVIALADAPLSQSLQFDAIFNPDILENPEILGKEVSTIC